VIPSGVVELTRGLKFFVVEELRTARRYLSALGISTPIDELCFFTLNEHSSAADLTDMLKPLLDGNDVGLMSDRAYRQLPTRVQCWCWLHTAGH
jgi:16S rRNA (cytidine1402-2'-O)-methyltransferase